MVHAEVFIILIIPQRLCYTGTRYFEHMFHMFSFIYLNSFFAIPNSMFEICFFFSGAWAQVFIIITGISRPK
jgi:hypothetical protein